MAQSYDANGNTLDSNMTAYDAENHLVGAGWNFGAPAVDYAYDAQGKRFFLWTAGTFDPWGGNATNYSVVMYSPSGQKLGTYRSRFATRRQQHHQPHDLQRA